MADISQGVPERVWAKALQLGMHNDCIAATEPCKECEGNVMLALEFFYGDLASMDAVFDAIAHDLATERLKALEDG